MSDRVVGRKGSNRRVITKTLSNNVSGKANGGHGISPLGLNQDSDIPSLGNLRAYCFFVRFTSDDRKRLRHRIEAVNSFLQEALPAHSKVKKELRSVFAREGPQPRAHSTRGNNNVHALHTIQCNKREARPKGRASRNHSEITRQIRLLPRRELPLPLLRQPLR